jgi:hypothetical protein
MGINYNPRGVSEGLIYYIDPYNNRSYSGTGNTVYNLVNASIGGTFVGSTASPIDSTSTRTFFMGGSNYINCPNNIPLTNNFTVSVWFKLNAYNNSSIINKWFADSSPTNHRSWFIGSETSSSSVVVVLSSDGTYTNPTIKRYVVPVNLNEYTNITFTFATGILTVYKNGLLTTVTKSLDASFTTVYDNPTRPIQIGYGYDSGNYYGLANVGITQIYNRVLSPTEILQNYDAIEKRYYPEENIVRDGLILNLDPGNSRSYAGAGNTIYDLSGTGNSGFLTNGPTFSAVNRGSIIYDGTNDYLSTNNIDLSNTNKLTLCGWVKILNYREAVSGANLLFEFTSNFNSSNIGFVVGFADDSNVVYQSTFPIALSVKGNNGYNGSGFAKTYVNDLKWHYWSCIFDKSQPIYQSSLYIDGSFVNFSIFTFGTINTNNFGIDKLYIGGRSGNFSGNASISQVKIYNRVLSQQEIQQNYNATKNRFINTLPPVRDNLILNLDAGDLASYPGSGTTWFDLSGNSLNGTLTNGPTFSFSDSSSSIVFDRSNDYVTISDNSLLNNFTNMTLEVIVRYTTTNNQIFAQKWNYTLGSDGYTLEIFNSVIVAACYSAGANYLSVSTSGYPINNTYHIILTLSGSTQTLYINGVSVATNSSGSVPNISGTNFTIGSRSNLAGSYFGGNVYLTKFYNRALSAAEILQNFNFYRTRYGI